MDKTHQLGATFISILEAHVTEEGSFEPNLVADAFLLALSKVGRTTEEFEGCLLRLRDRADRLKIAGELMTVLKALDTSTKALGATLEVLQPLLEELPKEVVAGLLKEVRVAQRGDEG